MLPKIRSKEYLYPIPEYDLKPSDVKNFIQELKGFHEIFEDCFHRRESRNHFLTIWQDNLVIYKESQLNLLH